ncbi:MAG: hypothetical protein IJT53_04735 [Prevotella sp.]|nr:hypothetical protein [Prevotella sp.]
MNAKTKRHTTSWVLLAVFVPMLLLSSLHVHPLAGYTKDYCSECVQHHCHGHLAELPTVMHQCVLCQFVMLTFVAAAAMVVVCLNKISKTRMARQQDDVPLPVCGIPTLRAPPFNN